MKIDTITLNWKTPSEKKIYNFLENFNDEKKKSFSEECIEEDDNGNVKMNRKNAKKWLTKEFDGTDYIKWEGRPADDKKRVSAVSKMAEWKNL